MAHKINYVRALRSFAENKTIQRNDRGSWVAAPFCPNLDLNTRYQIQLNQHATRIQDILLLSCTLLKCKNNKLKGYRQSCHKLEIRIW